MTNIIYHADCLRVLDVIPEGSVDLIYIDPPFNEKATVNYKRKKGVGKDEKVLSEMEYKDARKDYFEFMERCLYGAHRVLKPNGSIYVHMGVRYGYKVRAIMDQVFGEDNFLNEVVWSWDYGGRSKKLWSNKHDNIYYYAKDKKHYTFNYGTWIGYRIWLRAWRVRKRLNGERP